MFRYFIYITLLTSFLLAQNIDALLEEYELNTKKSLKTVDEKLGHVTIYSQEELKRMQYTTLADLLKEFPINNFNNNKFGISNLSLSGSKTDVSGFFRFFINDHEVSSTYTQSASLSWINLPLDFIDYIEVYRGNSSFALGSDAGIFFIRIYTKNPMKENGSQIVGTIASHGTNSQSITHADIFQNGWSYLSYFNNTKEHDKKTYKNNTLENDTQRRYFYLNIQKENTNINFGYTDVEKDNYIGLSVDANPDSGNIESKDYFFDFSHYFLDDKSLKVKFAYDFNEVNYEEKDSSGLEVLPVIVLPGNPYATLPKEYYQNIELKKYSGLLSKTFSTQKNNFVIGTTFQNKKYITKQNTIVNFMTGVSSETGAFTPFNEETINSIFIQDDYKFNDKFLLIGNGKLDKYNRNGGLDNFTTKHYRVGAIYTPFERFGIKSFYTKTSLAPTFYNIDYADITDNNSYHMKNQEYKYYTIEGVYADEKSRLSVIYNNVKIENFIYYSPVGFTNIDDHTIKTQNWIFDYTYELSSKHKLQLNYYTTSLSETLNNSNKGGYIKFTGEYDKFDYFTSLIYKNGYQYTTVNVPNSYNLNLGATYHLSKNLFISLKGENLLNKSTKSLYKEGLFTGTAFALEDYQREVTLSMKWVF